MWRWNHLERKWVKVSPESIYPGLVLMLRASDGCYDEEMGWTGKAKGPVPVKQEQSIPNEGNSDDPDVSTGSWVTLIEHTNQVFDELNKILTKLDRVSHVDELLTAARWHDAGKAHPVFQRAMLGDPPEADDSNIWAKTKRPFHEVRYERRGFRHELASAIAILQNQSILKIKKPDIDPDLVAYLAAAHHGKVRLSIRSMPNEKRPDKGSNSRFARGVWDGDQLPETDLGGSETIPETEIRLNYMEIGEDPETGRSWLDRMLRLRDTLGPFRLAFLEALLRMADWRASANSGQTGSKEVTQ